MRGVVKRFICCFMVMIIMASIVGSFDVNAASINERIKEHIDKPYVDKVHIDKDMSHILAKDGGVSVKEELVVRDIKIPLYATFDAPDKAIDNIASNKLVMELKKVYNLEDISDENWQSYYEAMLDLMDSESCPEWYNECNEDYILLSEFFDIYENDSKNKEIIDEITSKRSVDLISDISVLSLLPYDAFEKIEMIRDEIDVVKNNKKTTVNGFNVENGIKYATDHATSPNTTDYKKFSSDCTNFVSQILENGGVKQVKYNDENKGWWHVKKTGIVTTHKHSISWIRADTFAKYMGVPYTTKSHASFSENIQKGDFIALDKTSDGDWDHMGFVTDKKSKKSKGYYDYKVAQHTTNYHRWVSDDKNGWENIGGNGGTYGRVRR